MELTMQLVLFAFLHVIFGYPANTIISFARGPSVQYEVQRRRVESNARGLRDYVAGKMMKNTGSGENRIFKAFFKSFNERTSMLQLDLQKLWAEDGHAAWREVEAAEVRDLVQRRLHALQHPKRCTQARKLVCKVEQPACEFGCQLDHLMFCLSLSYGTRRTLVLDSRGWRYHAGGWGEVFQPLSDNCTDYDSKMLNARNFASGKETEMVLMVSRLNKTACAGMFMPPTIPSDLADRIVCFAGDPAAWWAGQLLAYILRPREHLAAAIARTERHVHYHRPIVGFQIRRTDKIELHEMIYHSLEEYIFFAENYYWVSQKLMFNTTARRVYIATEDSRVLFEARCKFRSVQFISDPTARIRSQPSTLLPLLTDITLLAAADFIVCTLSSHVCTTAYALMLNTRADALGAVHSLDEVFYLDEMRPLDRIAVAYHKPSSFEEIELMPGDLIAVSNYSLPIDGFGIGFNSRTNQKGKFPWFKTMNTVRVHPFPTYDEIPLCVGECQATGALIGSMTEMAQNSSSEARSSSASAPLIGSSERAGALQIGSLKEMPPTGILAGAPLNGSSAGAPPNGRSAGAPLISSAMGALQVGNSKRMPPKISWAEAPPIGSTAPLSPASPAESTSDVGASSDDGYSDL